MSGAVPFREPRFFIFYEEDASGSAAG